MNKTTEALKLAEEALEELHYSSGTVKAVTLYKSALAAIREVLAQPVKQEPVEWHVENVYERGDKYFAWIGDGYVQIFTAPVDAKAIRAEDYIKAYQQGRKDMKEEAAKVCDDIGFEDNGYGCAAAIRSME